MFLRFAVIGVCLALIAFVLTQLIVPAILNQPLLALFRRESRLDRAKRLKAEAVDRKRATQLESETLQLETEERKMRDEAFERLNR